MTEVRHLTETVPNELAGRRIDQVLAAMFPDYSRTVLKRLIESGKLRLDTRLVKPKTVVHGGERIDLWVEPLTQSLDCAELIPLTIIHEDEDLIVVNKPAGLVVHPGAGNPAATLLNALLHHEPALAALPRAGIVHRLDKDTSGLLVVARSLRAHTQIVRQLQARTLSRDYQAIARGVLIAGGAVDAPVGRHSVHRTRMAVTTRGKPAVTHYRVLQRFRAHTHLHLKLDTGRTHQIRVHMAALGYPLVGDPIYGGRQVLPRNASDAINSALRDFKRQALHAWRLRLMHPASGQDAEWSAPLPDDMVQLLELLAQDSQTHAAE